MQYAIEHVVLHLKVNLSSNINICSCLSVYDATFIGGRSLFEGWVRVILFVEKQLLAVFCLYKENGIYAISKVEREGLAFRAILVEGDSIRHRVAVNKSGA
jgi:hypothetical protein